MSLTSSPEATKPTPPNRSRQRFTDDDGNIFYGAAAVQAAAAHFALLEAAEADLSSDFRAARDKAEAQFREDFRTDPELCAERARYRRARERGQHIKVDLTPRAESLKRRVSAAHGIEIPAKRPGSRKAPARATSAPAPAGRPVASTTARPRERRERHVARSTSSGDSGSDCDEPPTGGRCCEACGADISHRRADARTCDALCRKRLNRGTVTGTAQPTPLIGSSLEDEIERVAHERHVAWSAGSDKATIDALSHELDGLYSSLRLRRARQPLAGFQGRSASVIRLPSYPMRRQWREAVAA